MKSRKDSTLVVNALLILMLFSVMILTLPGARAVDEVVDVVEINVPVGVFDDWCGNCCTYRNGGK